MAKEKTMRLNETKEVEYTHTAIGMFKNTTDGVYYVAEIQYNPVTGEVSPKMAIIEGGPGKDFGIERFKIHASIHGLVQ